MPNLPSFLTFGRNHLAVWTHSNAQLNSASFPLPPLKENSQKRRQSLTFTTAIYLSSEFLVLGSEDGQLHFAGFSKTLNSTLCFKGCPVVSLNLLSDHKSRFLAGGLNGQLTCWSFTQSNDSIETIHSLWTIHLFGEPSFVSQPSHQIQTVLPFSSTQFVIGVRNGKHLSCV